MGTPREEYSLLLEAPNPVEADLAQNLLEAAGIPSLLHGQSHNLAELGAAVHAGIARPDLYVPKEYLVRAQAVLEEAWGSEASESDPA